MEGVPLQPVVLTDPDDPRIADFQRLTDVQWRRGFEPDQGLFVAEGTTVISRALACGYLPRTMLLEAKWWPHIQPLVQALPQQPPVYLAAAQVLQQITGYAVHRGALASFHRPALPPLEQLVAGRRCVAVLEDLVDHTNLGAIFRSAAALGVQAVVLSPRCADPLYRRSIKVSMGAVLALPYTVASAWPQALDELVQSGFTVLALTPRPDARPLSAVSLPPAQPRALLLGAEGPGLSDAALSRSHSVRIPMPALDPPVVDSLNVAAAAAIAFHALAAAPGGSSH